MYAVDLHTHTRFFHSFDAIGRAFDPVGYRLLRAVARRRGLDGVALTNHDSVWTPGSTVDPVAIPGIEVSTSAGHVLVVGPDPPARTTPGALTPAEAVTVAHDRGCAAILAHPFRNSSAREQDVDFDAVEINGKSERNWERTHELAADRDLPLVGGSDAHYPVEVGRAYTLVDADDLTPESVVAAIRDGRVEPAAQTGAPTRVVRRVYDLVHRVRGHRA